MAKENSQTSAAAFVEGGVQDACDDACSICLEVFSEDDPETITVCKHEYHLQCILEWSQRSKECPMCWQPLYLRDKDSQLLLAASEQERTVRQQRSSPFYQDSSSFDHTQFQSFSTYTDDSDFEDQILHHLAAAERAQQLTRSRESLTARPSPNQDQSQSIIAPIHTNHSHASSSPSSSSVVSSAGKISVQQSRPSNGHVGRSGVRTAQVTPLESTSSSSMVQTSDVSSSSAPSERTRTHKESGSTEGNSLRRQVLVDNVEGQARSSAERLQVHNGTTAELGTRASEVTAGVAGPSERMSLDRSDKQRENSNNEPSRDTDRNTRRVSAESGLINLPERIDRAKSSSNSSRPSRDTDRNTRRVSAESGLLNLPERIDRAISSSNSSATTRFSGWVIGSASSSSRNTQQQNRVGSSSSSVTLSQILSCFGRKP